MSGNYNDFSLFQEKVKVILWSIRTFWYNGLGKNNEKSRVLKKGVFLEKIVAQVRRLIFRKVFIWYLEVNIE